MSTILNGVNSAAALGSMAGLTPTQRMAALEKAQAAQSGQAEESGRAGESMFGSIFNSLIQNVKDTDAEFVNAQYLLATGQLDKLSKTRPDKSHGDTAWPRHINLREKRA